MSQTAQKELEGEMRSKNTSYYRMIIDCVNKYFDEIGKSPSTREIESATGISRPTVQRYLRELCERGELEYDGHRGIITEYMRGAADGFINIKKNSCKSKQKMKLVLFFA